MLNPLSRDKIKIMKEQIVTPGELQILIHYWCVPGDYNNLDSTFGKKAIKRFIDAGLIVENKPNKGQRYSQNHEAMEVYIKAVCSVPLPVQKWTIE